MVERNRGGASTPAQGAGGNDPKQPTTPGGKGYQQAAQVKEQVQDAAAQVKEQVTGQATEKIEEQKGAAAGGLNSVAHAFRQTGDQLQDQDQGQIAGYIHRAAGQIENFSDYLGRRNLSELARDTEAFARREPALFLGGAFTLGLFAARFLKSSGQAASAAAAPASAPSALPAPSAYQPPVAPTAYGSDLGLATAELLGNDPLDDVIVGGPPLPSDVIVGGPPREPRR